MIVLKDRKFGLPFERVWFWNGKRLKSHSLIIRYLRCSPDAIAQLSGLKSVDVGHTLINDLSRDESDIFASFKKNYKYEIRRAEKEEAAIYFYSSDDLLANPELLTEFEAAYNSFCDSLQNETVRANYRHDQTTQCIEQKGVLLTKAVQNGAVVYHLYYVDGKSAVLDYSISDFRDENVDKAAAGRLNKLLHWEDMKFFKTQDFTEYDWGNVTSRNPENFNGIDKFKAGFGGELTEQQSAFSANSILGLLMILFIQWRKEQRRK